MPRLCSSQKVIQATFIIKLVGQSEFTANDVSKYCGLSVPTCRRVLKHLSSLDSFKEPGEFAMVFDRRWHRPNCHKVVYKWFSGIDSVKIAEMYGV